MNWTQAGMAQHRTHFVVYDVLQHSVQAKYSATHPHDFRLFETKFSQVAPFTNMA